MSIQTELKPKRDLLDPNFDGYKLSLEPIPVYSVGLDSALDEVKLTDAQYSYQHVKAFGTPNLLISDPWNSQIVYYVDSSWNIKKFTASQGSMMSAPITVFQIPNGDMLRHVEGRVNVSMYCASGQYVCLADGAGSIYLLHTGDRMQEAEWKVCYKGNPVMTEDNSAPVGSKLLHALYHLDNDISHIDCLLLHVHKNPEADNENQVPLFLTTLTWITVTQNLSTTWELTRSRHLHGASAPDYCCLEQNAQALIVATEKPYEFVYDSLHPIIKPQASSNGQGDDKPEEHNYGWTQSEEDATVFFSLPPGVSKPDIAFNLTTDHIDVGIKNGASLLKGSLQGAVKTDECTWTISEEEETTKLEIHLEKASPGVWPEVVKGDRRGHLVADLEQMEEIHRRLSQFTSDKLNPDPDSDKVFNSQQLEECDIYPDESFSLSRFDGNTHEATHKVNLSSNQWLFNVAASGSGSSCLCLRHDVDGLIWQPVISSEASAPWQHVGTFNAFGYVQASKQQKKFCSCAPDFSYVVIADCMRHVYIYRQPSPISSPLRNRVTGRQVAALAKQQLVSFDSIDNIVGLSVHNDNVYVIAGQMLYMIRVNQPLE